MEELWGTPVEWDVFNEKRGTLGRLFRVYIGIVLPRYIGIIMVNFRDPY